MDKKIKINDIIYFMLGIYLFFLEAARDTIYYKFALILLGIAFIFSFINKPKFNLNLFLISYLLYIAYQLLLYVLHIPLDKTLFFGNIKSLFLIFIILFMIYNIITREDDINKFLKLFVFVTFFALIAIMISSKDTLFTQRLAHSYARKAPSFIFLGVPVYMSANTLSLNLDVAYLFALNLHNKKKNAILVIIMIFFGVGVLLTQSRKGILLFVIFTLWWINEINKGKYLRKIIILVTVSLVAYFSIMNIPFLYESVGKRFEILENYLFKDEIHADIQNRDYVKDISLEKIKLKPVTGYGEGAFVYYFSNITQSNSENNYLELLIHGGIIGLIIYYLYTYFIIKNIFSNGKKSTINKTFIVIMLSLILIEFGSVHYNSLNILVFIIMYFSYKNMEKNKGDEQNEIKKFIN